MQRRKRLIVLVLIVAGLLLAACGGQTSADEASNSEPAKVEPVDGTELNRVILSAKAAERLDIQTALVQVESSGTQQTVIPYAAVLYDPNGETWTYTSPEPLVFVRQDFSVDHIEGDLAVLLDGPPPGTAVVTVGATELWGIEYGGIEED